MSSNLNQCIKDSMIFFEYESEDLLEPLLRGCIIDNNSSLSFCEDYEDGVVVLDNVDYITHCISDDDIVVI